LCMPCPKRQRRSTNTSAFARHPLSL
jgi:hypothetical protein